MFATVIAIGLNIGLGIKMLVAHKQALDGMDEMIRKVHFNAMAISLGLTMIAGSLYGSLESAGVLTTTPQPSNILFVMGISYIIAVVVNYRKYA